MLDLGIYHYNARFYSPALGRFLSADTVVPGAAQSQAYDRYAYVTNSPLVYSDPSGHFPIPPFIWPIIPLVGSYYYHVAVGNVPDARGIYLAQKAMGKNGGTIEVAAGLAVQAEFSGLLDTMIGDLTPGSSGYGISQTNQEEITALGLGDLDPMNPADAVIVMQARIENALEPCQGTKNCSAEDRIIIAALAQNGMLDADGVRDEVDRIGGSNWERYIESPSSSQGQIDAQIRNYLTGINYKQLMLRKYVQDMKALNWLGWSLPEGISLSNLENLENLTR